MKKQQMHEILDEFKAELAENEQIGKAHREKGEALINELTVKLNDPEAKLSGDEYLLKKLKEVAEDFEVNHPKLTEILGRVSDLLARMGI